MNWLPWGRKKKFDFNAFLVSKAKQQKHEQDYKLQQKELHKLETTDTENDDHKNNDNGGLSSSIGLIRKRASVRAQSLSTSLPFSMNQPKSFSLVLTDEDLKGLELQRKLETLRRQGEDAKKMHREEKEVMTQILGESKKTLAHKLRDGIDWSEYLEIAQQEIAAMEAEQRHKENGELHDDDDEDAGSAAGSMSSVQGRQEADLMKAMHKVELQERTRKRLQEFTNDEILLMYKMESTIKEDFAEREAKILSQIAKVDANLGEYRQCHEACEKVYGRMIERLETAAEQHVERVYKALRENPNAPNDEDKKNDDGELKERRPRSRMSAGSGSYSSRILAVNAQEKEESRRAQRSLMISMDPAKEADEIEEETEEDSMHSTSNDESHSNSDDPPGPPKESPGSSKSPSLRRYKHLANKSSPPYARSTGASRNTRISGNRASSSPASRASAVAAARSRAAGAAARAITNGGAKPVRAVRTASTTAPHRVQSLSASSTRPARTLTNVQPRRVNSATARR
ncbi:MAG: hypothetical protein SGILL_006539 [Bacillariaceae sp.]